VSRRNIGVAIVVPEPFCSQLQAYREQFRDPNAATIVPHVTLLPPTLVPAERLPVIEHHLSTVAGTEAPFDIALRGSATFRPVSPVVFVALAAGISDCERLERKVRAGPLHRETRFPYHPHVTVAHDLPPDALDRASVTTADYRAQFAVTGFSLFEQEPDESWRPCRDFTFSGQGRDGTPPDDNDRGW
jgi:2'-5' RNA ligase